MLLDALNPKFAEAQQVPPDDKRLKTEYVEYPSPQGYGKMKGYLVRPAAATGKLPAILVVHENRGLNPHIEDIARRLALDNFMAFAPDALAPLGGYPGDEDKARALFAKLDQPKTREDFVAADELSEGAPRLHRQASARSASATAAASSHMLATRLPDLAAAVPFYGNTPAPEEAAKIKAPLLIHFAENDERINAAWPAYEDSAEGGERELHRRTCTRERSTASTTTRRRATTRPPRSSRGSARSSSSTSICASAELGSGLLFPAALILPGST